MSIHRKVGRFRAVIAAGVLAIGTLAAVPASTQPAIAQPTAAEAGCTPVASDFDWETEFSGRGVTLCRGYDLGGLNDVAFVQIVDLNAGAKIRLVSEKCSCPYEDLQRGTDAQFHKRTAEEWFDWTNTKFDPPNPASELFSTSNASFFTDTSGATSKLSLPQSDHWVNLPDPPGARVSSHTWGWAYAHHEDPAWDSPKRAIHFGDVRATKQKVEMFDFPTHFEDADVRSLQGLANVWPPPARAYGDSTVGFEPGFVAGDPEHRRTFVGVDDNGIPGNVDTFYILNVDDFLTVGDAQAILDSFGSVFEIQLDGGGSTQLYANGETLISPWDPGRQVPDALAVYLAP